MITHCNICDQELTPVKRCACPTCPQCGVAGSPYCPDRHAPRAAWPRCVVPALPEPWRSLPDDVLRQALVHYPDLGWRAQPLNEQQAAVLQRLIVLHQLGDILSIAAANLNPYRFEGASRRQRRPARRTSQSTLAV